MKRFFPLLFLINIAFSQDYADLNVETIDGTPIVLSELVSQGPVLINFWALWCEPCKLEMRHLQSLFEKYKGENFSIVAVNQDNQKSIAKVSSYTASQQFTFHVVADPDGEIAQQFNVQNIPLSILIDRNGKISYKALGYKPGDEQKLEESIIESLKVGSER